MYNYYDSINDNKRYVDDVLRQKTIDKRIQSLHYSYETLFHLLSSAENFAGLKNEQYEGYNISISTKYEDLKSEFIWELHCFQLAKKMYEKKYGEYIFPNELPQDKILFDIKRYIQKIKIEKDKALYYALMNIIVGVKIEINFDELFEELDKDSDKKFDPEKLKNLIVPINHILNNIERDIENGKNQYKIRKFKSKSFEKLIKESYKNKNIYLQGIIGKKGYLSQKNENSFVFECRKNSLTNKQYKTISLEDQRIQKGQKLYKCKVSLMNNSHKNGFIYFLSDNFQQKSLFCCLFDEEPKNCPEQYINIIDEKNGYGNVRKGDYKDTQDILLIKNDSDDLK